MTHHRRRTTARSLVAVTLALTLVACGEASPSPSDAEPSTYPLSAIACATEDPDDAGELTGAWSGSDGGVYYIRQVGDCVWWFGTELDDIESGQLGQPGFANVATGYVDGLFVVLEWADLPAGDVLGGGGLTFVYDSARGQLSLTEQRGNWLPYFGTVLTRVDPNASPEATPSPSPSP